ncbi:MAG: site-specific DNA-methyltransferase [Phycisphaerales bacterium]|nr:site-specific DNA-methyltransferase [Phycisphaerales bacterium]
MTPSKPFQAPAIIERSAESMRELPDESVMLTVTSPPYFNAVDYDRYAAGLPEYKTRSYSKGFEPDGYESYLSLMQRVFREVYRVTAPGGWCVVVAASILRLGKNLTVPFDLTSRLQDLGWELCHEIIWDKGRPVLDRAGAFIKHRTAGSFHPNISTEHILVFRRPGPRLLFAKDSDPLPLSPLLTREIANNLWHIPPVPPGAIDHPCPFPEEIPHRAILLYSVPGALVLDPFSGSGQTGKVAIALNRRFVGYEIEARFAELARSRLKEPLSLRAQQMVRRFEHIEDDPFLTAGRNTPPKGDDEPSVRGAP